MSDPNDTQVIFVDDWVWVPPPRWRPLKRWRAFRRQDRFRRKCQEWWEQNRWRMGDE